MIFSTNESLWTSLYTMVEIATYNLVDIPPINLEIRRLKDSVDLLRQDFYSENQKKSTLTNSCLVLKLALSILILVITLFTLVLTLERTFSRTRQQNNCENLVDPYNED